jgi:hypothetical protein
MLNDEGIFMLLYGFFPSLPKRLMSRKLKTLDDLPSYLLLLLIMITMTQAWLFKSILTNTAPGFVDAMNNASLKSYISGSFFACLLLIILIGLQFVIWSIAVQGCIAVLRKRVFGV